MKNLSEKLINSAMVPVLFVPIYLIIGMAFAWVPMLGWNHSIAEMFSLPKATFWQAFWFMQLTGYVFIRPTHSSKND